MESRKNGSNESIYRTRRETQRTDLWTQCGKERVRRTERAALKHIHYMNYMYMYYITCI